MTTMMVEGVGWVDVVLVLDWYTKKIVGYYAGVPGMARHWLEALDMAVNRQCPDGTRGQGGSLMRDNGCQPTSLAFMQACATLAIQQAFTSDNHPKGHADTERGMRTLKEECLWLHEWTCPFVLVRVLERGVTTTTAIIGIPLWVTRHPSSLNGTTTPATALRSWPLDKWGTLQGGYLGPFPHPVPDAGRSSLYTSHKSTFELDT
jgi:transposase InsO family protein